MLTISYSIADQPINRGKSVGILNVSLGLAGRLARHPEVGRFTVFLNDSLLGVLDLPEHTQVGLYSSASRNPVSRVVWDQWGVYRAARRTGNEWLLLPKGFASFVAPCPVRLAAIVHDTMHDYYKRTYPTSVSRPERWYFDQSLKATIRHASVIFTDSDFAAEELARVARAFRLECPPVVTMGVGFSPPPADQVLKEDRVLVLVSPFPHKRTELAIDYLQRWKRQSGFCGTIDCVGKLPHGCELPTGADWRHHGRMPDNEYQRLVRRARVAVFFSEYEGFGMPPVEAVLAGACPVYSDIVVAREVMEGAGCPFSNRDFGSFQDSMNAALSVSGDQIAAWAAQLLRRHNWAAVEKRVVDGLRAFGS